MAYYLALIEFENGDDGKKSKEKAVVNAESLEEAQITLHKHLESLETSAFDIKNIGIMNQVTMNI